MALHLPIPLPFDQQRDERAEDDRSHGDVVDHIPEPRPRQAPNPDFPTHFLALSQVPGIGRNALVALADAFNPLSSVWSSPSEKVAGVLHAARIPKSQELAHDALLKVSTWLHRGDEERAHLERQGYRLISRDDPAFPPRLRDLKGGPRWLFYEGNVDTLTSPAHVAVVGTRKASSSGCKMARHLTRLILEDGLGIVSGLAEGIDACAHETAARVGAPQVAVLGTGITVTFPQENSALRARIAQTGGVIVTEYLPYERYGRANFVRRNRLQAALALAVCPVEATVDGGTRHTVNFAREYGRPVFGVTRSYSQQGDETYPPLLDSNDQRFDISTPGGRLALNAFLDSLDGDRVDRPKPVDKLVWVRNAVTQLEEMRSYFDVSEDEARRYLAQLANALGISLEEDGENRGSEGRNS